MLFFQAPEVKGRKGLFISQFVEALFSPYSAGSMAQGMEVDDTEATRES